MGPAVHVEPSFPHVYADPLRAAGIGPTTPPAKVRFSFTVPGGIEAVAVREDEAAAVSSDVLPLPQAKPLSKILAAMMKPQTRVRFV